MIRFYIQPLVGPLSNKAFVHPSHAAALGLPNGGDITIINELNNISTMCSLSPNYNLQMNVAQVSTNILDTLEYSGQPLAFFNNIELGKAPIQSQPRKRGFFESLSSSFDGIFGSSVKPASPYYQSTYAPQPGYVPQPAYAPQSVNPMQPGQNTSSMPNSGISAENTKPKLSPEERIKKLTALFNISNKVKLDDVAKIIGLTRGELLQTLLENSESLSGFKIDGDYLVVSNTDDLAGLIGALDEQFTDW